MDMNHALCEVRTEFLCVIKMKVRLQKVLINWMDSEGKYM